MFFIFLAFCTESFSYKHCLLSTSSRNPIFSCEQVPWEVFGRFYTESAFWLETFWTRSQICQRDLQTCLSSFHSYRHTFTHTDSLSKSKSEPCETQVSFLKVKYHTQPNWTRRNTWQEREWRKEQQPTCKFLMRFTWDFKRHALSGKILSPPVLKECSSICVSKHCNFEYYKQFPFLTNLFSYFEILLQYK